MTAATHQKILIANRGEIAVRVINTCRLMDIKTVAIFAEDDRHSLHRKMADEAYSLGSGGLGETYLNGQKILEIAKSSEAWAIHPGYGFLSERADFCEACEEKGVVFIGPSAKVIRLMGDKKESKQTLESFSLPLIPGYHGEDQGEKQLLLRARSLGVPLLIKAASGGGGKGMQLVEDLSEFPSQLARAKREAQNAFGDPRVILETLISRPRHIEVQVLSDSHGGHFHFWERECSIQRRHQKIIEETPAPSLGIDLRQKICQTAVDLCEKIEYRGAGTVEFIFDEKGDGGKGSFYFLEMNTRLQVEHPITEMVTGYDLVEGQIRVARGEKLNLKQEDISQNGHALEVRLYAEDPDQNFLPTAGTLRKIGKTQLSPVRVECGLEEGSVIGIQYDPMIAKLCCHGYNRDKSIRMMELLLNDYPFLGLTTNREFLQRILRHPKFLKGEFFTNFIADYRDDLAPGELSDKELAEIAAAYFLREERGAEGSSLFHQLGKFRNC